MATEPARVWTYDDLLAFPEDLVRREVIGGELFVTPSPSARHQDVVVELTIRLGLYAKEHGGKLYAGPLDLYFSDTNVVEPDVLYLRPENLSKVQRRRVLAPPDLVVEISSPSTRRRDLGPKRDLYERFGVPEFWFVDLDRDRIEVRRLEAGRYGEPVTLGPADVLTSPLLPGLSVPVDEVLIRP